MRINFSKGVKKTVAERNGFRCSFRGCDRTTVGPGASPHDAISTGVAAHIHSASPGGPRGQAPLSPQELEGIGNALWLCANHARIVDAKRGVAFPPTRLHSFKAAHEALIGFEQRGVSFEFGWLQSLVVEESPLFTPGSRLDFGRATMIVGGNASGKTALCEWLAGCTEISFLKRWSPTGRDGYASTWLLCTTSCGHSRHAEGTTSTILASWNGTIKKRFWLTWTVPARAWLFRTSQTLNKPGSS